MNAAIGLIQFAANAILTVLGGEGVIPGTVAPLVAAIMASITPLIAALQGGEPTENDILAGYGALIGTLNAIKKNTNLPQATLDKIQEYILAAQDATTAYIAASKGYDPTTLVPVKPIQ